MSTPTPAALANTTSSIARVPRVAVAIDYQNMHLVGHENWHGSDSTIPTYSTVLEPWVLAEHALRTRRAFRHASAELCEVHVFRGEPDKEQQPIVGRVAELQHNAWTQRHPNLHIHTWPLHYFYNPAVGRMDGREKGIDVLMGVWLAEIASRDDIDLVLVLTHDHDLNPAVQFVVNRQLCEVEFAGWDAYLASTRKPSPLSDCHGRQLWTTYIPATEFPECAEPEDWGAQAHIDFYGSYTPPIYDDADSGYLEG